MHREDWHLLGIHWQGRWYVDKCLPFGLRSLPALFNRLATSAIQLILQHDYSIRHLIHYLDDFFTAGPAGSPTGHQNMSKMNHLCEMINAPIKPDKEEGPSTSLTFLGILLDTTTMQASIAAEKKTDILHTIQELQGKCTCKSATSSHS